MFSLKNREKATAGLENDHLELSSGDAKGRSKWRGTLRRLATNRARTSGIRCVLGSLAVVLSLLSYSLASTPAWAADGLGELEEPGQPERRSIETSDSRNRGSKEQELDVARGERTTPTNDSDGKEELQPDEATSIMPDGEAVDQTIIEDKALVAKEEAPSEEEVHPEEATAILPDSEAVDESIQDGETPVAKESSAAKSESRAPAADPQWSIRWQNAFIVERVDDPGYQFLFGGRIQNDWGVYAPDSDLKSSFGGNGTGTKFRRARLYFQGQFFRYGFFKAEYDFSSGSDGTAFSDVYVGLNLPDIGLLRVGYFKEPFQLQFLESSNFISFNERAGSFALNPDRNSGIMLNGNFLIRDSTYSLAVMRRTDDIGEGFSSKEDYHITGRLTGLPYFEDGGARLLHIELGYSHQFADKNDGTQYEQSAANDFAPTLVDTGSLAVDNVDLFNAGFAVVQGPLSLQSEFTLSVPHGGIDADPVFWGAYAELSWWVTGENRRYLRGRGVFSRVVPKRRFDPKADQWGAVELAARYSWLDLSNDGIRGGTLAEWSFAINWVLFSNLRMSNNFVLSQTADRARTDAELVTDPELVAESGIAYSWVTRFQIDF